MHVFMHFKAASKAGPSEPQRLNFATSETVVAQVSTTAATAAVQGRIADTLPWVTLHEFPESGLQRVPACPQMRFDITATRKDAQVSAAIAQAE